VDALPSLLQADSIREEMIAAVSNLIRMFQAPGEK
jgi:hypothetical protein